MTRAVRNSNILYFKFFVYLMGIALVFGSIFLSYTIYERNSSTFTMPTPEAIVTETCSGGAMTLQVDGEVELSMQDGNKVFLLSKTGQSSQELVVIDYCANKVISRISFNNNEPESEIKGEISPSTNEEDIIMIDSDKLSKAG
jgi:hypothetical protein